MQFIVHYKKQLQRVQRKITTKNTLGYNWLW